jgi:hypothetical protein
MSGDQRSNGVEASSPPGMISASPGPWRRNSAAILYPFSDYDAELERHGFAHGLGRKSQHFDPVVGPRPGREAMSPLDRSFPAVA